MILIVDTANNPLGGAGTGNGNFNAGDLYNIEKNAATVTGILLADPNPSRADNLRFTVNFSKEVSGVDVSDFALVTTGGIWARL